jgi:hypothetical protein
MNSDALVVLKWLIVVESVVFEAVAPAAMREL